MWLEGKEHCFWTSKAIYMSVPVCAVKTNAWSHLPNHASHPITMWFFTFECFYQDIKAKYQGNTFIIPCLIMEAVGFKYLTALALHAALWRRRWSNELYEGNYMFVEEAWALPGVCGISLHSSAHSHLRCAVSIQEEDSHCASKASSWCSCCSCQMGET